jgi:hypothetical protein
VRRGRDLLHRRGPTAGAGCRFKTTDAGGMLSDNLLLRNGATCDCNVHAPLDQTAMMSLLLSTH